MMSFDERYREEARYIMLRALADEMSEAMVDALLQRVLETFGILRSREWVLTEIGILEQLGAVRVTPIGRSRLATLTERGRDHLERRIVLAGVKRPTGA